MTCLLWSLRFKPIGQCNHYRREFEIGYFTGLPVNTLFLVQPQNFTFKSFLANRKFQMKFAVIVRNYVLQAKTNFKFWPYSQEIFF